jgi:hypothetical protein
MARQEDDREDLLAEARALVERVELVVDALADRAESIVAGFRRDGCLSVYFGADPAYHFNTAGQLRRAYLGGLLYKAEQGRLVSLERRRADGQVQLVRHELDERQQPQLLEEMRRLLERLGEAIATNRYRIVGQVPADADVVGRLFDWLRQPSPHESVAPRPNVG